MQKSQQGFTLIELMIVIAIAGILMMIAIPSYQGYVARAQVTEALSLASNLKVPVADAFSNNGECLEKPAVAITSKNVKSLATSGPYTVTGGCTITSTMSDAVSGELKGKSIALTLRAAGEILNWECSSNIKQEYLPKGCNFAEKK